MVHVNLIKPYNSREKEEDLTALSTLVVERVNPEPCPENLTEPEPLDDFTPKIPGTVHYLFTCKTPGTVNTKSACLGYILLFFPCFLCLWAGNPH